MGIVFCGLVSSPDLGMDSFSICHGCYERGGLITPLSPSEIKLVIDSSYPPGLGNALPRLNNTRTKGSYRKYRREVWGF